MKSYGGMSKDLPKSSQGSKFTVKDACKGTHDKPYNGTNGSK